ncbi:LicD family protein [Arenibacter sp. F20364]|uniref:LicD family protein n=1 Tax=Arenibacter sp. F20364 TaxID=2926415 RepID=UPI001FF5734E|nr:LicD family protein [Arenibacter sp. F20364]MCK0190752.1 LicD family protein [Arenibacter sp. F20364]
MAYNITLEGKNKVIAERMLQNVATLFNQCNIDYWIEGGTLLGIRRENRLLPWDNDIDVSINHDQIEKLEDFYTKLRNAGYRVRTRYFNSTTDYFAKGDIRMIKIREKRFFGLLKGAVCLDVFIKYPKNGNSYWEIDNKTKYVPTQFYQSFGSLEFKGFQYKTPALTDEYLTYRYGDWQTPVKNWDTSKDDNALA